MQVWPGTEKRYCCRWKQIISGRFAEGLHFADKSESTPISSKKAMVHLEENIPPIRCPNGFRIEMRIGVSRSAEKQMTQIRCIASGCICLRSVKP